MTAPAEPALLFAYGTLLPGDVRWHHLERFVVDHGADDRTHGRLFDTGCDYPAAVFDGTDVVHGRVFTLRAELVDEALAWLDDVEGAVAGDYRRVVTTTAAGHRVWAYEYGGGLTLEPIAGGSWRDHCARLARG